MRLRAYIAVVACLLVTAFGAGHVQAQFLIPGIGTDLSILIAPEYPAPQSSVRLSATSRLIDLSNSDIRWYANEAIIAEGVGVTNATVTVGDIGSEIAIRVLVNSTEGEASATGLLRPTHIDLLWEADTYVPPFYRGRALPSAGSTVRLFALPRFQRPGTSSTISPDDLIYTWKKDGKVLSALSGRGKYAISLENSVVFGSETVSVEVRTSDNTLRGFSSVRLPRGEPSLVLYEHHPVFGIQYHRAIRGTASISDVEATFSAVPYFLPTRNISDRFLRYEWRVNRKLVATDTKNPSAITLNAEGSSGTALLELALSHASNVFLNTSGRWNVSLERGSAFDPFSSGAQQ